ncbi:testican-1-like [Ptychodera flava]|uniref:testican-1-like n=1 Tax=Ptychodera flava TaxID=63121 RepID=UPI00396A37D0
MRLVVIFCLLAVLLTLGHAKKSQKDWKSWKSMLSPVEDTNPLSKQALKDLQEHTDRKVKIKNKKDDLCDEVKCGHSKTCQIVDNKAVCTSKHKVKNGQRPHSKTKKGSKKDCPKCPVVHPYIVCGSDGVKYSDQCHLERRACITGKRIIKACDGRCPCTELKNNDGDNEFYRQETGRYDYVDQDPHMSKESLLMTDLLPAGNAIGGQLQLPAPAPDSEEAVSLDCTSDEMEDLPNRLVEWFRLLKEDEDELYKKNPHKAKPRPAVEVLPKCKESTAWMFTNMDLDRDMVLTPTEYKSLYDDNYEICMVPFLDSCDTNLDRKITGVEWCICLHSADDTPPCYSALADVPTIVVRGEVRPLAGAYVPSCDETGYYAKTQCHSSTGYCWCVDKYGTEYGNTRVLGAPACDQIYDDTETEGVTELGSGLQSN